jgi:hypothetical protein
MNTDPKFDLEDRLIDFAVMVLDITEQLPLTAEVVDPVLNECIERIQISGKSISTARKMRVEH